MASDPWEEAFDQHYEGSPGITRITAKNHFEAGFDAGREAGLREAEELARNAIGYRPREIAEAIHRLRQGGKCAEKTNPTV